MSLELGNMPHELNSSMTSCRRCSNVLRCPFSAGPSGPLLRAVIGVATLPLVVGGCNGVRGDRSSLVVVASVTSRTFSMLKSGPKNRCPITRGGVAVDADIALFGGSSS